MWKWIKKIITRKRPPAIQERKRRYRTYHEIEEEQAEIEEMLLLSDPGWIGDVARKHHG